MLQKLIQKIYVSKLRKLEVEIGCKLIFRNIPSNYINGWVSCDMTKTWKKFGLEIEKGANYFTMGHVVHGDSSRFDQNSTEYQSWLGGYTIKLSSKVNWDAKDYFKLAIADQNSWLKWYGDPHPMTSIEGWNFNQLNEINIGQYSGYLYEFGCTSHSDMGKGFHSLKLYFASLFMVAMFNFSNPKLKLKAKTLRPVSEKARHKILKLKGYIAIVDINENIKVVFYGNGVIAHNEDGNTDTFEILKNDLLEAIKSCEIKIVV